LKEIRIKRKKENILYTLSFCLITIHTDTSFLSLLEKTQEILEKEVRKRKE